MSVTALQQQRARAVPVSPQRAKTATKRADTASVARSILRVTGPPCRKSRVVFDFTAEELAPFYHLPQREAAKRLGVAVITIKRTCKRRGIRWPYRDTRLKQLQDARARRAGSVCHEARPAVNAATPAHVLVVSDAALAFARLPFECMAEHVRSVDVRV